MREMSVMKINPSTKIREGCPLGPYLTTIQGIDKTEQVVILMKIH